MALSKKQLEKILIERYGALENAPKTKTPVRKYEERKTKKILEKYPISPMSFSSNRSRIATSTNEFIKVKKTIDQLKADFKKEIISSMKRNLREKIFEYQNMLEEAKKKMYAAKNRKLIKEKGYEVHPLAKDLTINEVSAMTKLEKTLSSYSKGDMTITKFYHSYGFDMVDKNSLYAFVKGEGLA